MTINVTEVANGILEKIKMIPSNTLTMLSTVLASAYAYFSGSVGIYYGLIAIVIIDAVMGVLVAVKKGEYALSELLRNTGVKLMLYTLWFMAVHIFEKVTFDNTGMVSVMTSFVVASIVELISIAANGLILKPDFPFFRIMLKPLKGEIAKKLGITPEDVEDALSYNKSQFKEIVRTRKRKAKNEKGNN